MTVVRALGRPHQFHFGFFHSLHIDAVYDEHDGIWITGTRFRFINTHSLILETRQSRFPSYLCNECRISTEAAAFLAHLRETNENCEQVVSIDLHSYTFRNRQTRSADARIVDLDRNLHKLSQPCPTKRISLHSPSRKITIQPVSCSLTNIQILSAIQQTSDRCQSISRRYSRRCLF